MSTPHQLFDRATAAGRLMADLDWGATPIGPPESWPESLRGQVRTVLSSRYPMLLLWGEEFTQLYNDAYSALIGDQHPSAMGGDVRVTLAEGWPVLGPIIAEAVETGVASWVPALQLLLERAGYREEAWFSVSHAPARDDQGTTRGVLTVCSEVTEQVVGQRRLRLLRDLALTSDQTVAVDVTSERLVATIADHPLDVPFAGLYLREGGRLRCAASSGVALPELVDPGDDDPWGLASEGSGGVPVEVAGGAWGDPVRERLVLPLPGADRAQPLGVLLVGVSPSRALDEDYRSFFELLAQQVAVALRNARAYEEERARAEALAELDRVKTGFFTNVSHEFRTPLTLMLGPLQDALADEADPLPAAHRDRVETAARASQRLLKLVNDLLTFSSLEAGRADALRRAVDLAAVTSDVASSFRAAVERAGLTLEVDCPPLPSLVAVDPEHWEKVVGNLLSNALKFTFTGGIAVRLLSDADGVRLEVADTGVGIPEAELPRLFDRFHRVTGTRSRSHEGSGIGLALVRELTVLHGGLVEVDSEVGHGTRFVVRLPWTALEQGAAVAAGPTSDDRLRAAVEEAASWTVAPTPTQQVPDEVTARVLVADDNADMRDYLARLLRAQGWSVETVADGDAALERARRDPPDLLLTDVMMPGLDGFELVRALRADERTATLPIVVLSARAGEEASVEGLDVGADDYVVKPFTSQDLVARLRTTMSLARQRSTHVRHLGALADAAAVITSGQQLEQALETMTAQVRALLRVPGVGLELLRSGDRPPLELTAGTVVPGPSVVELPLAGRRGRTLGAVRVALRPDEPLSPDERALLQPLTRVLAAVAERSWDVERDTAVAATLQRHLLPDGLPEVDGLALAARYLPAERDVKVGGDWYDVLALPDGRVALSVGDVAGHGLTAALVMGQLRTAVRAYCLEGLAPRDAVGRLDDLVSRLPDATLATLFLGHLDLAAGSLTWCSAGHPPPVLLTAAGDAAFLDGEVTPPLGAGQGSAAVETTTPVADGARLVLYTDGLVEDRASQLDAGLPALLERVRTCAAGDADGLVAAVLGQQGASPDDDTAVLVVQRMPKTPASGPAADVDVEVVLPGDERAAGQMRRELRPVLRRAGLDDDLAFELLLAASEAVNNAVEHAVEPSRDEVRVRVTISAADARVVLQVSDFGRWRERRPSMDRGRGSALMSAGGQVQVLPGEQGTVVTIVRELAVPS